MKMVGKVSIAQNLLTHQEVRVDLPLRAKVISCGNQNDTLVIWAELDDSAPRSERRFFIAETGKKLQLPVNAVFVGTVLFLNGAYVCHVYDLGEA